MHVCMYVCMYIYIYIYFYRYSRATEAMAPLSSRRRQAPYVRVRMSFICEMINDIIYIYIYIDIITLNNNITLK